VLSLAQLRLRGNIPAAALLVFAGCSQSDDTQTSTPGREMSGKQPATASSPVGSLGSACPSPLKPGSVQVARVAPEEAETGIAFDLLGDGAGPGVLACSDVIYADARALMSLMGNRDSVSERDGRLVVGTRSTAITVYRHDRVAYARVADLAQDRRALFLQRGEHRMDAVVWPQPALRHLKDAGLTQGAAYQTALREGLIH
jgi:hypothetical protein